MNATVTLLALAAAVLHATWNAVLRTGTDRLWTVTVMSSAMTVVAIPFAFVLPLPSASVWPYVVGSSMLQVGYSVFLVAAYRHGQLAQVYPIVRGSVPLLVTAGGLVVANQHLTTRAVVGVVLVGVGIMALSVGRQRAATGSIVLALVTGAIIASYSTVDAMGVRAADSPAVYTTWICLTYGTLLPVIFVITRGRLTVDLRSAETRKALIGGIVSLAAYGSVIVAFSLGPAGPITALRETSVVFAALIGRVFLNEVVTQRRATACAVVVFGAICLR